MVINGKSTIIISIILLISIILGSITASCVRVIKYSDKEQGAAGQASSTDIPKAVTGTITTGAKVDLITTTISPSGGTITVTMPGDPVDGLKIEVPPGAYTDTRTFKISSAPIQQHTFGTNFTFISPLIHVDNGGEYSEEPMLLKIPLKIPQDHYALAFFYDSTTGKLEAIPRVAGDKDSVTLATRHFSNVVIAQIPDKELQGEIDSEFKPKSDCWAFMNGFTYVEPNGICGGWSLSAMWYYYERTYKGEKHLRERSDNNGNQPRTERLWKDDNLGWRLAAVVQKDWPVRKYQAPTSDTDTAKNIAAAILKTHEPQLVFVDQKGKNTPGHALICYKVKNLTLYIVDPNYPMDSYEIKFNNGKFEPYIGTFVSGGQTLSFDRVIHIAKTACIDWGKLAKRWSQFQDGTIGNGIFPSYTLQWVDGNGGRHLVGDTFNTNQEMLEIIATSSEAKVAVVLYKDQSYFSPDPKTKKYKLAPGKNQIGIGIVGDVLGQSKDIDFKWVNVYRQTLAIEPSTSTGEPNKDYKFTALTPNPPGEPIYEWFVDGKSKGFSDKNWTYLKFDTVGRHEIMVTLVDNRAGSTVGRASAVIEITEVVKPESTAPTKMGFDGTYTTQRIYTITISGDNVQGIWGDPNGHESMELIGKIDARGNVSGTVKGRYLHGQVIHTGKFNGEVVGNRLNIRWEYDDVKGINSVELIK